MTSDARIRNRVIRYFAWVLNVAASEFGDGTRVRDAYRYNETWKALADTFNSMSWMKRLEIRLSHAEMGRVGTIGEIAELITVKAKAKGTLRRLSNAEFARLDDGARSRVSFS